MMHGVDMQTVMNETGPHQKEVEAKSLAELEQLYAELAERFRSFLQQEENLERRIGAGREFFLLAPRC
jgi:uncharacterized damage-inducible protein DinB